MLKKLIVVIGLIGLTIWGIYNHNESSDTVQSHSQDVPVSKTIKIGLQEGDLAPDFELETLDGQLVKLSELKGKKIILNFWATWCPPCKAEMPHMQSFYEDQDHGSVEILAVNLTNSEQRKDAVNKFVEQYQLTFPILLDQSGEIGDTYRAYTIPTSYYIDSSGIIVKKIIGPMDKEMMNEMIKSIN
ncbi:redoxin domain-containing protein [Litchfieldia salsa]|uniref:Peroxiredoxin n=1 Tax=Litchfieldia salsa TaxID=930152 RepID=A0A1H0WTU2_9BACI|nr:redoxin domain-containing protein [Litchfieldia salsa]SDP94009.1 Peroxiredoxin [Litchfieldia salsa]